MEEIIRLTKIEIKELKNVSNGIIDFKEKITGIYGQNGSGKTALVDAMNILKSILCGKNLDFAYELISVNSEFAELNFHFDVIISEKKYKVILEVILSKLIVTSEEGEKIRKVTLKKEIIKYSECSSDKNNRKKILIGTTEKEVLKNNNNFKELVSKYEVDLKVSKKLSETNSTSFLFNPLLIELLDKVGAKESQNFINVFRKFGLIDLIVITNENLGAINLNTIFPLTVKTNRSVGNFIITDQNIVIEESLCDEVHKIINQINIVLNSIIPNMSLELFEKNKEFVENDKIANSSPSKYSKIPESNSSITKHTLLSLYVAIKALNIETIFFIPADSFLKGIFLLSLIDINCKTTLILSFSTNSLFFSNNSKLILGIIEVKTIFI